jgi:dihydropyrimidinase/allantoinase
MQVYDLVIKGGNIVLPYIGVIGEKIAAIHSGIDTSGVKTVIDAAGRHVFPGAVDSH